MNIIKTEIPFLVEAKTTGCNNGKNGNVNYHFIESAHSLCLDKEELLQAQVMACKRLLNRPYEDQGEKDLIEKEIIKLSQALNIIQSYPRKQEWDDMLD